MNKTVGRLWVIFTLFALTLVSIASDNTYQMPPKSMADLVDAPRTPSTFVSPDDSNLLLAYREEVPGIAQLAETELRLAGLRINPRNSGPSRPWAVYNRLTVTDIQKGTERALQGLPEGRWMAPSWSPDGRHLAVVQIKPDALRLWVADAKTLQARQLGDLALNGVLGWGMYQWMADSSAILCRTVPSNRGSIPQEDSAPAGPNIQETTGTEAAVRTYQDLLASPQDEALFSHFFTSQIALIGLDGTARFLSDPQLVWLMNASPDGNYVLVTTIQQPFSYLVPYSRFPQTIQVWDRTGKLVQQVAEIPLAENIPKGFGATRTGIRSIGWREDQPATLVWAEAQDGGDPRKEAAIRDHVYQQPVPFQGKPELLIKLALRYYGIDFGNAETALVYSGWWRTRKERTWVINPGNTAATPTLLFDRSSEDRYTDPGNPLYRKDDRGKSILALSKDGQHLFMSGRGASPEGYRPFLDKVSLKTGKSERLWQSQAPHYEQVRTLLDDHAKSFLTQQESVDQPANFMVRKLNGKAKSITNFPHPYPHLKDISKELISYKRADGVELSATLYLPPGYDRERDGPLPVVMWAYPREFKSANAAGQVTDSPYRFLYVSYWGPMAFLTQGYAVLDNPSMPIIGEGEAEPNDTYVQQLVAGARAAIDEIVRRGVADRDRIAIGGHSYGAFMVANLLAHSDLFSAGIARSGAYNRTLTPFGFQAEERTFWEAKDVYSNMSSFFHADKINEPILLIHGEADNNSGTYPLQSRRLFSALKGLGGTARLVMLPHESHGYRARESLLHTLWESHQWLEKYTKKAGKRKPSSDSYNP